MCMYTTCSDIPRGCQVIEPWEEHMHVVTVAEMRELEARADREYGLTSHILMENEGKSAAEILANYMRRRHAIAGREVLLLIGPGNNGGDGLGVGSGAGSGYATGSL